MPGQVIPFGGAVTAPWPNSVARPVQAGCSGMSRVYDSGLWIWGVIQPRSGADSLNDKHLPAGLATGCRRPTEGDGLIAALPAHVRPCRGMCGVARGGGGGTARHREDRSLVAAGPAPGLCRADEHDTNTWTPDGHGHRPTAAHGVRRPPHTSNTARVPAQARKPTVAHTAG